MVDNFNAHHRRLLDKLKNGAKPNNFQQILNLEQQHFNLQMFVETQQSANAESFIINYMKLKVLENWEATKGKAVERMADDFAELLALEQQLQEKEMQLDTRIQEITLQKISSLSAGMTETSATNRHIYTITVIDEDEPLDMSKNANAVATNEVLKYHNISSPTLLPSQATNKMPAARASPTIFTAPKFAKANAEGLVVIGPNGTKISEKDLNAINWSHLSGAAVTRKLLMLVFDRDTLAFHTLSGKQSPAFVDYDKPRKQPLDPAKVADIVDIMIKNRNMTRKEVRCAITAKCADENKMYRQRQLKLLNMQERRNQRYKGNQ